MTKAKQLILLLTFLLLTASCGYFKKVDYEVKKESLSLTKSTSFDVNKAQMGGKITEASVHGEITNISEKTMRDIVITYKFPRDKVTAKIKFLKPGQTRKFATTRYKAHSARPSFKLGSVTYTKE
ncbi:MAG: hypothetical protein D8M61_13780 [Ignavibacteriae bacterium]|jgi:hypothetical protein|nr:hypothetical protein [Ignavibacteriota bacterium]